MPTSTDDKVKRLGSIELFRHCSRKDLEAIAAITDGAGPRARHRAVRPGPGRQGCFIVVDGTADVEINGRCVATVGPGEAVGEMGLLDHLPRSATVTARTADGRVRDRIGAASSRLLATSGVARGLLELLSRRIRDLESGRGVARTY